ncbi:phage holin family protein [Gordonia iterans]
MIRFLLNIAVNLVSAAVAFLIAWAVIDGFDLSLGGFFIAVALFTALQSLLGPFVFNIARQYASAILGGIGLVSTLLALWITTLISGALSISGVSAWIASTVVVWLVSALAGWGLGYLILTRWWDRKQEAEAENAAADAALARREAKKAKKEK